MRQIIILACSLVILFSCKKDNSNDNIPIVPELTGKWRMISIKDNSTNLVITKPSIVIRDVDITFTFSSATSGRLTGVTPANTFESDFSITSLKSLAITQYSSTKVAEPDWGSYFSDNITFAQKFYFSIVDYLVIETSTNKTIVFIPL